MNRFFRTAFAATLAYLCLTLILVLTTHSPMPFLAFSCLYFGLLLFLLPGASPRCGGKERLFAGIGFLTAMLGFVPLVVRHCPLAHWLVQVLGIVFTAVFLVCLRHRTTHSDFMAKYRFTVSTLLILIGFVYLSLLAGIYRDGAVLIRVNILELAISNLVPYAIVLLMTGVLLLRGLRAQEGVVDERAFNRRQLRDTLIFTVLVTLLFVADPFVYLKKAALYLFTDVLRPTALFLVQLLDSFLRLISRKRPIATEPLPTPEPSSDPGEMPVVELAEAEPERYYIDGRDLSLTIAYIFLAAAALILLWILAVQGIKLIRRLRNRGQSRGSGYPNETRESLPQEEGANGAKRRKRHSDDPRVRMRYLYAEFLRYLRKYRVQFSKTSTCGEIQRRAKRRLIADSSTVSDFTALYEQARYRLQETPTQADARRMKNLLDRIKRSS